MVRTPKYLLIEHLLGRPLEPQLRAWQAEGHSTKRIAILIRQTTGIDLTGETVRTWLMELDAGNGEAA